MIIEAQSSQWFVDEMPESEYSASTPVPIRAGYISIFSEEDLPNLPFVSVNKINRDGLQNLNITSTTILSFADAPDVPLGVPCQFLQVPKNGACFYSAASWALKGSHTASQQLRKIACDYIENNPELYKSVNGCEISTVESYLEENRRPGFYADYLQIIALSHALNLNIFIFFKADKQEECYWNVFTPPPNAKETPRGNIYMMLFKTHYTLVLNVLQVAQSAESIKCKTPTKLPGNI